jgi:DNA (cytosine-5)-methyltransferase 1
MNNTVISLFSGAGGLDIGLEAAGFDTRVAVEMDEAACSTLRHNRPSWTVIQERAESISSRRLLSNAGLKKWETGLLVGGPPCQPFSKSSYWAGGNTKRLRDPRAATLVEFMRVLEDALPQAFILENVPGFVYRGKDEGLKYVTRRLTEINDRTGTNYSLSSKVLNAADYGVPQIRFRTVIVGVRDGIEFKFPTPRYGDNESNSRLRPYRTAWDAIGDLPTKGPADEDLAMNGKWAELLASIPEGENYLYHTDRKCGLPLFGWRTRFWTFLLKLAKRLPSWTLQAQPGSAVGPFHWRNRRLSQREMLRIQTFPDSFSILGSRVNVQRQIGNAVPCLLAEILGLELRKQLSGESLRGRRPTLLPRSCGAAPRADRIQPVPKKYLNLVGRHPSHPGTGRGPGAILSRDT